MKAFEYTRNENGKLAYVPHHGKSDRVRGMAVIEGLKSVLLTPLKNADPAGLAVINTMTYYIATATVFGFEVNKGLGELLRNSDPEAVASALAILGMNKEPLVLDAKKEAPAVVKALQNIKKEVINGIEIIPIVDEEEMDAVLGKLDDQPSQESVNPSLTDKNPQPEKPKKTISKSLLDEIDRFVKEANETVKKRSLDDTNKLTTEAKETELDIARTTDSDVKMQHCVGGNDVKKTTQMPHTSLFSAMANSKAKFDTNPHEMGEAKKDLDDEDFSNILY